MSIVPCGPSAPRLRDWRVPQQISGFDAITWKEFSRLGAELVQRMVLHVQKEEMALLPLLNDTMDQETENSLYESYTGAPR